MTNTILIEINKELYDEASLKTNNIQEYIEEQLRLLVLDKFSDEYDVLVEIKNKIDEIQELEAKLTHIREKRISNDNTIYDDAMVTITRIHDNLGMIGKNQIKQIAKHNNLSYEGLLKHISKMDFVVVNYTGISKK